MLMNEYVALQLHKARQAELNVQSENREIAEVIAEYKAQEKKNKRWFGR